MHWDTYAFSNPDWRGRRNVSAKEITTFRAGGVISSYFSPIHREALISLISYFADLGIPFRLLGQGSNVLVRDEGLVDPVICTRGCSHIEIIGQTVTVDCGVSLPRLILYAANLSLGGIEALFGIPATIGGAIYMNAGAYGMEIGDRITSICVYDPTSTPCITHLSPADAQFSYRSSVFQHKELYILEAKLSLDVRRKEAILADIKQIMQQRKEKQPLKYPSAGSTFRRPFGNYAARLIDQSGCKGLRIGDAEVSTKHGGFIINRGSATASDILRLIEQVRERVYNCSGILLEKEIEIW